MSARTREPNPDELTKLRRYRVDAYERRTRMDRRTIALALAGAAVTVACLQSMLLAADALERDAATGSVV